LRSLSTQPASTEQSDPIFYQFKPPYNLCPFCTRVRTFMKFYKIPYTTVLVNPFTKKELKEIRQEAYGPDVKRVKLPLVKIDGKWELESSNIVRSLYKRKFSKDFTSEELKWMTWVDENLIKYVVPVNYGDPQISRRAFEMASKRTGLPFYTVLANKYIAGTIMNKIATKLKGKYGMQNPKAEFEEKLSVFLEELGDSDFIGKSEPNAADLDVYSLLTSMFDANDLYREEIMKNDRLRNWFLRMELAV